MKHWKCTKCHHEWDGPIHFCTWCGHDGKILEEYDFMGKRKHPTDRAERLKINEEKRKHRRSENSPNESIGRVSDGSSDTFSSEDT